MSPDRPEEPDHGIDVDAAFADIVAHYGDLPDLSAPVEAGPAEAGPTDAGPTDAGPAEAGPAEAGPAEAADAGPSEPSGRRPAEVDDPSPRVLEPPWDDPLNTPASWPDEGHFVPPPPPPLPSVEPRRRAAWAALFGAPLAMVVVIVAGLAVPGWVVGGLAVAFIGGFVYLVATMRDSDDAGWPGDDGAVV